MNAIPNWSQILSIQYCSYKAWLLSKHTSDVTNTCEPTMSPANQTVQLKLLNAKVSSQEKISLAVWCELQSRLSSQPIEKATVIYGSSKQTSLTLSKYVKQVNVLIPKLEEILRNEEPPLFHRNSHCNVCNFKQVCAQKLKERDCISLLPSISETVLKRFQSKGISTITQLALLFRPRRRGRRPQNSGSYLWDLKALAIKDKKTYVIYPPELVIKPKAIYIDFEGIPDEGWIYLIGVLIKEDGEPDKQFSFWANHKADEQTIFEDLISILIQHPEANIYHYGSYEIQALRNASKKWKGVLKTEFQGVQDRMVNALSYLRTHVYPPTYGNGLKEVAAFLGFNWKDEADGMISVRWRKEWEQTKNEAFKEKLLHYNLDDCRALAVVSQWLSEFATKDKEDEVQRVADMKRHSPFKFQKNVQFGEDFKVINKAAYFDYQHTKIYWRNSSNRIKKSHVSRDTKRHAGHGKYGWNPTKVNEVVIAPTLKKCPKCGHGKLYDLPDVGWSWIQTDLKFSHSGIKQWVVDYRSSQIKCAKCYTRHNNAVVKRRQFGDNLFAWATNLYVSYHISHELISNLLYEQFGIWTFKQYFVGRQQSWWARWKPEVAYLWQIIKHSPVIYIDETSVKLSKDRGYVWVFATSHTVFYHFTFKRETDFLQEWLKDYEGVIVTDSFAGYETLNLKQQKCLIHLIRDLNDDLFKNPFDAEYKVIVNEFGGLLRKIIETIDRYGLKKRHLSKHKKDIQLFYDSIVQQEYRSGLSIKYTKRFKNHWQEMWTFLNHDGVSWNNNNAEAAVKAFALYRRGVNGQVGEKGIKSYLQMLSLAQTCRYRNVSFLDFLRNKVGIWDNVQPEILPDFLPYKQARLFTHRLNLTAKKGWMEWSSSAKRPSFIPASPEKLYADSGWKSWQSWFK